VTDGRVFPLLAISRSELERLVGGQVLSIDPVEGGLTNTLHRVELAGAPAVVVKHFAEMRSFTDELAALTRLAGVLPVPEVVRSDVEARAIVYRWIDGITLDDCRRTEPPAAFASLGDPLGRLFAWVARTEPLEAGDRWDVDPLLAIATAQLGKTRVRERMGATVAEALGRLFASQRERLAWGHACLCHHDIGGRNILVQRADGDRWRIGGVIDWEAAETGSPLVDIGGLFRFSARYDDVFIADFERGYREAGGELPERWYLTARLLDAVRIVETLDIDRELLGVFADCRKLLAKLVADLEPAG
jgi:aminoglycoside phosphotransferase (APT) family kinase protein